MRAVVRILGLLVAALLIVFVAAVGLLAVTSSDPRMAEGWRRLADMPVPRGETATAVAFRRGAGSEQPRMVVMGGIAGPGRTVDVVSIYSPEDDAWARGPSLPAPRDHAAAAGIDGTVFVSGGSEGLTSGAEATMWSLRLDEGRWDTRLPMPEPRWGHAMVSVGGRLYVIGGRGPTSRVLIFDPETGWSDGAPMPEPRNHLSAVVVEGRIWAIGGRSGARLMRRVDVYDVEADRWTSGPALPVPVSATAAGVVAESGVHVVGGENPGFPGGVIDRHFRLEPGWSAWRNAPLPIVAVHGVAGAELEGRLVVTGGSRRNGAFSPLGWTGITQAVG